MSGQPHTTPAAVFLSYAREDLAAARRIADALRAAGIEVWLDQEELRGGDAWDQKIRRQIKECALFVPVISANTQARAEGYFRLEWKLADRRTDLIGKSKAFLVPICIDDTRENGADVPDSFLAVQWTRLRGAESSADFCARMQRLLGRSAGRSAADAAAALPANGPSHGGHVDRTTSAPLRPSRRRTPDRNSVAVLAFANLSEEKENEFFAEGISEDLLNLLAKVPGLKVSARTSAFAFKGQHVRVAEIARQLGVAYLVDGSVQRTAGRVRIKAQLIKAADGFNVWSETFTRDLKDIFAVQDEIAGLIAQTLQLKLGDATRTPQTVNPEAHRLALEGRHFLALRSAGFARAEAAYAAAVGADPHFAAAHAGLADVLTLSGLYEFVDGRVAVDPLFARAEESARRAIALEPTLAEPHAGLGLLRFIQRRYEESERHFEDAVRLNTNFGMADHWHGLLLGAIGRFDLAMAALERSVYLDPLGHTSLFTYGSYLHAVGRLAESLATFDRAIAIKSAMPPYLGIRAVTLLQLGRTDEAIAAARSVRACPRGATAPHWWSDGDAIFVLQETGRRDEAREFLAELQTVVPPHSHVMGYALCALGRFDEGLPLLEAVDPMCQTRLYFMSFFESVQGTPRFEQLFAKLNSTQEYRTARATLARLRAEQVEK